MCHKRNGGLTGRTRDGDGDVAAFLGPACEIAEEAGKLLTSYFGSDRLNTKDKGYRDVVTAADAESEGLIRRRLVEAFPDHGVVAEEGTNLSPERSYRWYVDPLDGTVNFSRGIPIWCVSFALFAGNYPVLGIVHDPIRGETFSATKGGGARCSGERIRTSPVTQLSLALVHLTIEFHEGTIGASLDDLAAIAPSVLRTRNMGSAALALAYVAAGRIDVMIHRFAFPWDYGAGVLLAQEAGGTVSDIDGQKYNVGTSALVAASGKELHDRTLERLRGSATANVEWPGHST